MESERTLRERARSLIKAAKEISEPDRRSALIDEALGLAQRAEAMARQDRSSLREPARSRWEAPRQSFTLYLISGGHFADARHFDVGSDEAALAVAHAVHDACSETFEDFELWQGSRLVAGNAQRRGQKQIDRVAEIAAATQERVVELEESLMTSRRSLAQSRKLLEATDELRKRLSRVRGTSGGGA